jgi:hypothetical protein
MDIGPCVPTISSASEPPSPRGPWLFQGSLRLASSLTPSSAASLSPSARFPSSVIRTGFAIRDSLGWDRDLPSFTVVLSHHAILLRPRGRRQVHVASSSLPIAAFACYEKARPSRNPRFALSTLAGSWWGNLFEAQSVRCPLQPGELLASCTNRPGIISGRRVRLHLSFRPTSHLLRASGMTTAPTG